MSADQEDDRTTPHASRITHHLPRRRVYLMRHGDAAYRDPSGRPYPGHALPLSETGREQAAAAGRVLAEMPIDRAVVSGLLRTVETARIVLGDRTIPIEERPELAEIAGGRATEVVSSQGEVAFVRAFRDLG